MSDLAKVIKGLSQTQQLVVCVLMSLASIFAYVGSLPTWGDAIGPAFIGAVVGALIKDLVSYIIGRPVE